MQKEDSRKKDLLKSENNLKVIEKEIQTILTEFENLKLEINNEKKSYEEMEKLEAKVQSQLEVSEEIGAKEKEIDILLERKRKIKGKLDKLKIERSEIEEYYSRFINNIENIRIHENRTNEINKWLSDNSDNNNKVLLNTLEKELEKFDDRFNNIYDEQKNLEVSFDVFTKN